MVLASNRTEARARTICHERSRVRSRRCRRQRRRISTGMDNEIMNADEVAMFLRINRKTVYAYANRHRIPHQRLGRRIVFSKAALLTWLNANADSKVTWR